MPRVEVGEVCRNESTVSYCMRGVKTRCPVKVMCLLVKTGHFEFRTLGTNGNKQQNAHFAVATYA